VAAVAGVAAAPWTAVWALCGGWPEAVGSLGLAIVGGAATLSRRPLPITALALAAVGALPLAGPAAALGAFSLAALPAIWDDRADLPPNAPPGAAPWPASPWAALVARDLIGAWRTAPASVRTSVSTGLLLGACAFAVRRNGDPRQATTAVLCLSLAALPAATSLMQAAVRSRGGQADDPRLPFTSLERALSLSAVAAVGWAPAGLAVVLLGPGPAAPRAALTLLMGAAVAALAVPASLERARPRAEPGGPTLWVMLGLLTLILLPAAWAIPGLLGAAALGLTATTVGLARARDARR